MLKTSSGAFRPFPESLAHQPDIVSELRQIHPFSTSTLRLEVYAGGAEPCAFATGLLVNAAGRDFLATNWHVVTGRHPFTGELQLPAKPQELVIWHRAVDRRAPHLGVRPMRESLYDQRGDPRWIEPVDRRLSALEDPRLSIDVVLLPLRNTRDCVATLGFGWIAKNVEPYVQPGSTVSIVGYPRKIMGVVNYPVWKTGHVASDIHAHPQQKHFLIDSMTREGMSGAPVVTQDGGSTFLGVYSGRLPDEPEIGIVWRSSIVQELVERAIGSVFT
jgi:Trypsin-like peptidase domain